MTITLVDDGALEEHQGLSLFVAQRRLLDGESGQVAVAAHLEGDGAMLGRGGHVLQRGLEVRAVVLHGLGVEGDGGVGGAVRADLHALRLHLERGVRVGFGGLAGRAQQQAHVDGDLVGVGELEAGLGSSAHDHVVEQESVLVFGVNADAHL